MELSHAGPNTQAPSQIFLKDYAEPSHWIRKTELHFDIYDDYTIVSSKLNIERNINRDAFDLVLNGQDMELLSVTLDGAELAKTERELDGESLTIFNLSSTHVLEIKTKILPHLNESLEGLYKSRTMFCTQCEAEGFRKIIYYLDRPDVMSEFSTRIVADKSQYPVLLSNGNEVARGDIDNGRHWVEWHDPFLKPCYLFALVASDLEHLDDEFITMSGRKVLLRIFVESKDLDKCDHALRSLKKAMRWDEQIYGREYDLDIFMIVAVDDFNMGAMENKGLNIFNTSCVLANPLTTTDDEFQRVEGVVAHEYFHNWSGNRVTCRDWFQLSLKEGFTVFRDAEFSADMNSRTVKRVQDVAFLRSLQFAEDAGPMAHAVQPASFIEISNFYTLTIYEKGSEIVRMIASLLGEELFRKGSDLYFEQNDGRAATIEDFISAMSKVSGRDFSQFMNWYRQAGTPELQVRGDYDSNKQTYTLKFKQSCRPTPETDNKQPFVIPVALSLLGEKEKLSLRDGDSIDNVESAVIEIKEKEETVTFINVTEAPVPALLRGFSAPVKLNMHYSNEDLTRIIAVEDDGFCKWDAAQQLLIAEINRVMQCLSADPSPSINSELIHTFDTLLGDENLDPAMVALTTSMPTEKYLGELSSSVDVDLIHHGRDCVQRKFAKALESRFLEVYERCKGHLDSSYSVDASQIALRTLKNMALHFLGLTGSDRARDLVKDQFYSSDNMTDELAAFRIIAHSGKKAFLAIKDDAISHFYDKWKHEALVMNHWFSVQATRPQSDALDGVKKLMDHEAFDFKNPNKLRSLIAAFCANNQVNFHHSTGKGYAFLVDQLIKLNAQNPQIAARLITPLTSWRKYDERRQGLIIKELNRLKDQPKLSKDLFEVLTKTLGDR